MAEEDVEECWEEEMDLETLITSYGIDESAAQALRSCPEDVLGRVMAQGPLTGENPSALIMSRIRNEAEGAAEDPETFVAMVDARAKKVFNEQPEGVKQLIMDEGALLGYNPSAILMGRLRKAKDTFKKSGGAAAAAGVRASQPGVKIVARKATPAALHAAAAAVAEDVSGLTGSAALHDLGVRLCQLNAAFWDFDVPRADLMTAMKETLKTREAAVAAAWEQWPAEPAAEEPRRKKARQAPGGSDVPGQGSRATSAPGAGRELSDADQEQRRVAVLDEVVRMLGEAGGQMPLQDIGSAHLTDLRKGAVGNLSKFLSSRPDLVTVTSAGAGSSPIVALL